MISFSLVLTLRSLLLAFFEKRKRALHLSFFLFFSTCTLILWMSTKREAGSVQPLLLLFFSVLVFGSLFFRLKEGAQHSLLKGLVFSLFLVLVSLDLALSGYLRITQETPLVKITIPGERKGGSYLVRLRSVDDCSIGDYYVTGDLIALRAKIIRTKPFLHFLGLANLCKVERIFGCYKDAKVEKSSLHSVDELALMQPHPLSLFFENLWKGIFFDKAESFWIKSALMQANFFPLVDSEGKPFKGDFLLTLTQSGLSSIALSE